MPGGPAFFVQKRVGKDGRLFNCHKFRTMTVPDGSMILCTVLVKQMEYAGEVI